MKKILNMILVLMTLAFTSTVFAEIMEGIRIECKDADGKKVAALLIQAAASGSMNEAPAATANTGAAKGRKIGS
jgi:hypothetical protein